AITAACQHPEPDSVPVRTFEFVTATPTPTRTPTIAPTATPTPTPEPTPSPEPSEVQPPAVQPRVPAPTVDGCPAVILDVFGPTAQAACAVAWCESRWNPNATGSQGERGLFQVHPAFHPDATYDPYGNTVAAYRISRGGTDWSQWTCKPW